MEYIFGTKQIDDVIYETLKTKQYADKEDVSNPKILSGKVEVERKYADNIITDNFIIDEHYKSDTDSEGNVYNWYYISNHNRYIDKFTPSIKLTEREISDVAIDLMEMKLAIIEIQEKLGLDVLDLEV